MQHFIKIGIALAADVLLLTALELCSFQFSIISMQLLDPSERWIKVDSPELTTVFAVNLVWPPLLMLGLTILRHPRGITPGMRFLGLTSWRRRTDVVLK